MVLKYGVQLPLTVLDSVAALLLHRLEWVVDRGPSACIVLCKDTDQKLAPAAGEHHFSLTNGLSFFKGNNKVRYFEVSGSLGLGLTGWPGHCGSAACSGCVPVRG